MAVFGNNRDEKKLPCIVYGLLADVRGRPVSVDVYRGNTGDPSTVPDQLDKLRNRFGLSRVVLVGDRGMLTETQIDTLREYPSLGWVSALRSEAGLDGIYVLRTSESRKHLSKEDTVRAYKSLSQVEQAFRCLKGIDLRVRPIRHRAVDHVRAHVFLCTLAYYVEWHMRKALAPILFEDEELDDARATRDPVAKAEPSASVKKKKAARMTPGGWPVQSFQTLIKNLGTRCRNRCRAGNNDALVTFYELTESTPLQAHIFELLGLHP